MSYARLEDWLKTHTGYVNNLICKDVPGSGRGLFAPRDMKEGEILLEIPPSSMLNPLTLRGHTIVPEHLFPHSERSRDALISKKKSKINGTSPFLGSSSGGTRLDTTQLLTLHLALSRYDNSPGAGHWKDYVATVPESFRPWHPLTWLCSPPGDEWCAKLVDLLPKGTRRKLEGVRRRYEADLDVLHEVIRAQEALKAFRDEVTDEDLMWAWLNVNTRTVSIPLDLPSPSETHNHTLVPVLDMINHHPSPSVRRPLQISSGGSIPLKRSYSSALTGPSSPSSSSGGVPGKLAFRLVAPPGGLREGEEITFEYGSHPNGTLFAEYGFIVRPRLPRGVSDKRNEVEREEYEPSDNPWLNMRHGQVDLAYFVEELLPATDDKEAKLHLIKQMGYLDRYTLHTYPYPPYPSHSLIMALRIIHLAPAELESKSKPLKAFAITYISPSNEAAVNRALEQMLESAQKDRRKAIDTLNEIMGEVKDNAERRSAVEMVLGLWEEEEAIVDAVLERVRSGDTDW